MGGGDLNSKKSWHPNNLKNQERVWKAEQAALEEKKRITELQRERGEERDRAELNEMANRNFGSSHSTNSDRLHWMYDKPGKTVGQEDYLLGKALDKGPDNSDKGDQDVIPAVARRVVGSSMIASTGDSQVDLVRKMREDPLLLVKERERAARVALLNNPLQRQRLAELLRKDQEKKESAPKSKSKKGGKDLDGMLAAKLHALAGDKNINLASLLGADSSSESSSDEEERVKRKKKKRQKDKKRTKKSKKKKSSKSDSDLSTEEKPRKKSTKQTEMRNSYDDKREHRTDDRKARPHHSHRNESGKRRSDDDSDRDDNKRRRRDRSTGAERPAMRRSAERGAASQPESRATSRGEPRVASRGEPRAMSRGEPRTVSRVEAREAERAARLAAMATAGVEREAERGRRVAAQRAAAEQEPLARGLGRHEARSLPDSLESRLRSNRHYIQRDARHMNEHFARR